MIELSDRIHNVHRELTKRGFAAGFAYFTPGGSECRTWHKGVQQFHVEVDRNTVIVKRLEDCDRLEAALRKVVSE